MNSRVTNCTKHKLLISCLIVFRWIPSLLVRFRQSPGLIALKQKQPIALLDSHLKWYNHITRELSRECIATETVYGYYDVEEFNLWC